MGERGRKGEREGERRRKGKRKGGRGREGERGRKGGRGREGERGRKGEREGREGERGGEGGREGERGRERSWGEGEAVEKVCMSLCLLNWYLCWVCCVHIYILWCVQDILREAERSKFSCATAEKSEKTKVRN